MRPIRPLHETHVSDIDLAALLLASGNSFVGVEPTTDPRRQAFVIAGNAEALDKLMTQFNRAEATVNVSAFVAARRRLRSALLRGGAVSA